MFCECSEGKAPRAEVGGQRSERSATDLGAAGGASGIEYRKADITRFEELKPVLEHATAVIHVAGLAHIFSLDVNSVEKFRQINEIGTANVAAAAAATGVGHLILISSVSVYGPSTQRIYDENTPCNPVGPYALSKYNAEQSYRNCQEIRDGAYYSAVGDALRGGRSRECGAFDACA